RPARRSGFHGSLSFLYQEIVSHLENYVKARGRERKRGCARDRAHPARSFRRATRLTSLRDALYPAIPFPSKADMTRNTRGLRQGTALLALMAYTGCSVTNEHQAPALELAQQQQSLSTDPKAVARELTVDAAGLTLRDPGNRWAADVYYGGIAKR